MSWTVINLFCGMGGCALGFKRAGFEILAAVDIDPVACEAFAYLVGEPATQADIKTLEPDELARICPRCPDVAVLSPPCKGNSRCLPKGEAAKKKYKELNSLGFRGLHLLFRAWYPKRPKLIVIENVPGITSRSEEWVAASKDLLLHHGYAIDESHHDCGRLGGHPQHRSRWLLVGRDKEVCPEWLYKPELQRVPGVGEVLGALPVPVPGSTAGGPMHALPEIWARTAVRLALIPAGGDWRDLPDAYSVATKLYPASYGVQAWDGASPTVRGSQRVQNTRASIADPRLKERMGRHNGGFGVVGWNGASPSIVGHHQVSARPACVADPRITCAPFATAYGLVGWRDSAGTVTAAACHDNGAWAVGDPRLEHGPRKGGHGVTNWDDPHGTVIGQARVDKGYSVADPRFESVRREGSTGITPWDEPSTTVIAKGSLHNGPWQCADPRSVRPTHYVFDAGGVAVIFGPAWKWSDQGPAHMVIRSLDGTWHRPMTTLELAAIQGFPVWHNGGWLVLPGGSHGKWREIIGNAIPPGAAEAIARSCADTLAASAAGTLLMSASAVWVDRPDEETAQAAEAA